MARSAYSKQHPHIRAQSTTGRLIRRLCDHEPARWLHNAQVSKDQVLRLERYPIDRSCSPH